MSAHVEISFTEATAGFLKRIYSNFVPRIGERIDLCGTFFLVEDVVYDFAYATTRVTVTVRRT